MTIGFSVKKTIGIGDAVQFTSMPENYYRTFKKKIIDTNHHWVFDHNPFVDRTPTRTASKVVEMWNFTPPQPMPTNRGPLTEKDSYLSLAERHACVFGAKVFLKFPRLYKFEDFPFHKREMILFQTEGKSHGKMPPHVIDHVLKKYKGMNIYHLCTPETEDIGLTRIQPPTLWALAELISKCRMLIGMDSGPSWIAACYPDVIIKKLRTKPNADQFHDWIPMQIGNIHSHWDDRCAQICNPTEDDIGFTASYRRL